MFDFHMMYKSQARIHTVSLHLFLEHVVMASWLLKKQYFIMAIGFYGGTIIFSESIARVPLVQVCNVKHIKRGGIDGSQIGELDLSFNWVNHCVCLVNEPEELVDYEFAQREICMNDRSSGKISEPSYVVLSLIFR